jgi:hypothetical protein
MLNDNRSWQRDRRSIDDFVYGEFPDVKKLGDLKKLQAGARLPRVYRAQRLNRARSRISSKHGGQS